VAAGMVLAAAGMGLFLWSVLADLDADYENVARQTAAFKWARNLRTEKIAAEKKLLATEVAAVQGFLGTRVIWGDYLRDLPTRLPPNSCLMTLDGQYEMKVAATKKGGGQTRVNRSLTIRGMARFTDRGAPREIDSFLDSLRGVDLLKRDFPLVNLAEIKWRKEGAGDIAMFTIVAMPKTIAPGTEEEKEKPAKAEKG
jgi:Tfp pilus assembly protein PilN